MIPRWLPILALFLLLAGWAAVVWTLTAMIRDRRARRLAAEAAEATRQARVGQETHMDSPAVGDRHPVTLRPGDEAAEAASLTGTVLPTRDL